MITMVRDLELGHPIVSITHFTTNYIAWLDCCNNPALMTNLVKEKQFVALATAILVGA